MIEVNSKIIDLAVPVLLPVTGYTIISSSEDRNGPLMVGWISVSHRGDQKHAGVFPQHLKESLIQASYLAHYCTHVNNKPNI